MLIGVTWTIFKISGKIPSAKDWLIIKLEGLDNISTVSLMLKLEYSLGLKLSHYLTEIHAFETEI